MIPLATQGIARGVTEELLGRISYVETPQSERQETVRVVSDSSGAESVDGYLAVITSSALVRQTDIPTVFGCDTSHLQHGDVVSINARGYVRTLYRRSSSSNTLFA